ncbi:MAG: hypothetical protein ACRD8W_32800, partial [Nitrososphaeraceae archaeon]
LIVINKGGSGAKDCKAYIRIEKSKEIDATGEIRRTGWMLPDDNTALTVTLNVNMPEYVDLCAISEDGTHLAFTNERGFKGKPDMIKLYNPKYVKRLQIEATIIVASSNAQPTEKRIILHSIPPDEHNQGRIVKFVQASTHTAKTPSSETTPKKATLYNWLIDWMDKK